MSDEGLRYNEGKPRYDLIPPEFMEALAHHFRVGALKYADRNWEKGMSWGICFSSLMNHAWKWMRGEEVDQETGSHHMIAVAWNAMAIYIYYKRGIGTDTRNNLTHAKQEGPSDHV